jgi:hypothetical protein
MEKMKMKQLSQELSEIHQLITDSLADFESESMARVLRKITSCKTNEQRSEIARSIATNMPNMVIIGTMFAMSQELANRLMRDDMVEN